MKNINEAVTEILTTLQQRIKWLNLAHQTIIKNLLEIMPVLEKYKEYRDIAISTTGSVYIYIEKEGSVVIRISNHLVGTNKKRKDLVENLVF